MRKLICKIFNLIPKEDYDATIKAKNEVIINQSAEIGELRGKDVAQKSMINNLENENHMLDRTLKKCNTRPHTCVAVAYGSLLPVGYTEEALKTVAWNKLLEKIKDDGVRYDFRDGECVATLEVLV